MSSQKTAPRIETYSFSTLVGYFCRSEAQKYAQRGFDSRTEAPQRFLAPTIAASLAIVGAPRIELGPYAPKAYILPLYYAPIYFRKQSLSQIFETAKNHKIISSNLLTLAILFFTSSRTVITSNCHSSSSPIEFSAK